MEKLFSLQQQTNNFHSHTACLIPGIAVVGVSVVVGADAVVAGSRKLNHLRASKIAISMKFNKWNFILSYM